jgi:hypothetical protein
MTEYVEISGDFSQRSAGDSSPSRRLQAVAGDATFVASIPGRPAGTSGPVGRLEGEVLKACARYNGDFREKSRLNRGHNGWSIDPMSARK